MLHLWITLSTELCRYAILIGSFSFTCFFGLAMMYEVLFCFCILLHWRVFLPLVESSCQIWFPMLTFAFLSLPLLRKTDVKIRKQTEKRETKRKQETVFYVFLRVSLANIGKFKLSLKALILSAFTFICFLVFSNVFCRTKIFSTIILYQFHESANIEVSPSFPLYKPQIQIKAFHN